ncbi:serine-rich adhesin for platelets [Aedes albopictus]|uniref:Secreted protein n=1 Tax=Aedes albopictus TaxID=7160 RepID=A0ABM1ZGR6_AEDAL
MDRISLTDLRRQFFGPTLDESVLYGMGFVAGQTGASDREQESGRTYRQTKTERKYSKEAVDLQDRENITSADTRGSADRNGQRNDLNPRNPKTEKPPSIDLEPQQRSSSSLSSKKDRNRQISTSSSQSNAFKMSAPTKSIDSDVQSTISSDVPSKSSKLAEHPNELKSEKRVSIGSSLDDIKSKPSESRTSKEMENSEKRSSIKSTTNTDEFVSTKSHMSKKSSKDRRLSAAVKLAKVKVTKTTQTAACAFAGSPKGATDAIAWDKHSLKRVR